MNFAITNNYNSNILLLLVSRTQINFKLIKMLHTIYSAPLITYKSKPWFDLGFSIRFNVSKLGKRVNLNNQATFKRSILSLKLVPSVEKSYSYSKYLELTTVNFNINRVILDKIIVSDSEDSEVIEALKLYNSRRPSSITHLNLLYWLNHYYTFRHTTKSTYLLFFVKISALGSLRDPFNLLLLSPKPVFNTPLLTIFNLKHL